MKKDYMTRLSCIARWCLTRTEADDVLADYREILECNPRSESELYRELGTPEQVIHLLVQPKFYHQWLAVFALLLSCLLLPMFGIFSYGISNILVQIGLLLVGGILSFLWFQKQGEVGDPMSRKLLLIPAVMLLVVWMLIFWVLFATSSLIDLMEITNGVFNGAVIYKALKGLTAIAALTGVLGLVNARLKNRSWRALYMFSLTVCVLIVAFVSFLTRMDLTLPLAVDWQMGVFTAYLFLTALGLIGTGVSLC